VACLKPPLLVTKQVLREFAFDYQMVPHQDEGQDMSFMIKHLLCLVPN
jgi:hypothetical protein